MDESRSDPSPEVDPSSGSDGAASHEVQSEASLSSVLYDELRRLAHQRLRFERANHTLNTTALAHEAYLKLVDHSTTWQSRVHFLATAATIMRHILINYAEKRNAQKRGGGKANVSLELLPEAITEERADVLLALDEALKRLEAFDARGARIVEYRFFSGLTQSEIAEVMGVSERTVRRSWVMSKTWIQQELENPELLR